MVVRAVATIGGGATLGCLGESVDWPSDRRFLRRAFGLLDPAGPVKTPAFRFSGERPLLKRVPTSADMQSRLKLSARKAAKAENKSRTS